MTLFMVQFLIVLVCIGLGGRFGGIGLGAAGGLGLAILTFGFGLPPDSPPITVISIIIAVITCVTILQAAGGLDLLVTMAEKMAWYHYLSGAICCLSLYCTVWYRLRRFFCISGNR